jgi:gliding motility-associated-like protein
LKKLFLIGFLLFLFLQQLSYSQSVSGIVNSYLKVIEVQTDRVKVESNPELSLFQSGDKVMLIQMTGAQKAGQNDTTSGLFSNARNCGKFEILQIDEVLTVGPDIYIIFTDNVDNAYNAGEKIQLVRILEGDNLVITGNVTSKDWDGSTGGIVAMIGMETIALQADIDVTGKGFRGGQAENDYPLGGCQEPTYKIINFLESATGFAGFKGEGILEVSYQYKKGAANALNGGGGGNGLFSGGGGGSNYRDGGKGGAQSNTCSYNPYIRAEGGFPQNSYNKFYLASTRQIMMGGGGGAGTQNTSQGKIATAGGDGGGIILLITETLIGNGKNLFANGQSVTGTASASGGGGGGGGTILLDAAVFSGDLNAEANGGNGGNTLTNCTGAGGAGGGGVLWHSGTSLPGVTVTTSAGNPGEADPSCSASDYQYGLNGGAGATLNSLLLPLNGFLFNTIRGNDTICSGQIPGQLTGSNPKGGNGSYTYEWQQSNNNMVWNAILTGNNTDKDYQPVMLTQTTYFRRLVSSAGIVDTSRSVMVLVYPLISNNSITGTDTLCFAATAKPITGTLPTGGNGSYNYQWQERKPFTSWVNKGAVSVTNSPLNPGSLTETYLYRRMVTSSFCSHISNEVTLTVIPSVTNNTFYTEDTVICQSLGTGPLNATVAGGGDGIYRFAWLEKPASGSWQAIPASNVPRYDPGSLIESTVYRRIVFSGNDNACIDTSSEKSVLVLPSLTNNLISTDSLRYCAGDIPEEITGQTPSGGQSGVYSYRWQINTGSGWEIIADATGKDYIPALVEANPTLYRRLVTSGQYNACNDTSSPVSLEVIPYIINQLGLNDQTLCQYNTPLPFNPGAASGGYGGFDYQWLVQEEGSATWNPAPGISDQPGFASGPLMKTSLFRRSVRSDICEQSSDTVAIIVYPVIGNNLITGGSTQYTCLNTSRPLTGSIHNGGKTGDFTFLWENSTQGTAWTPAAGKTPNNLKDFESPDLTDSLYYRRIVFSSASVKECADTSSPVIIRINPLPSGDVMNGIDTLCAGETLFVPFSVSGGHGPYKVWIGDGGFTGNKTGIASAYDSIGMVFTTDQEIRMISIEDDSTCEADPAGFSNSVRIKVYEIPEADAGTGGEVCSREFTLSANPDIPSSKGLWTVTDGDFTDKTSPNTQVIMNVYGKAVITWTETNWQCADSDTVSVIFYEQPTAVDAGPDQTLDFLYTTQMQALAPAVGSGKWKVVSGSGVFSNDTAYNTAVSELSVNNLFRWTIRNGVCPEIKDSLIITVNPLEVQKGFTPNGDGINDVFVIPTPNAEKIAIKIYSRTGILIFESDNYTDSDYWKGTGKNNLDLPEGTYFYVMDIWVKGKSEPINFKSFVEILR